MPSSADQSPPAYSARPPKDGLLLGDRITRGNEDFIRVTAASDPLVGNALMALFVPVVKDAVNNRYVPTAADGSPARDLDDVGWVQGFEAASAERRPFLVPAARLEGRFAGVLVALLYNRTPVRGDDNFPAHIRRFMTAGVPGQGVLANVRPDTAANELVELLKQPTPIPHLPGKMPEGVRAAMKEFLDQRSDRLRAALIEIHA